MAQHGWVKVDIVGALSILLVKGRHIICSLINFYYLSYWQRKDPDDSWVVLPDYLA